LSKELRKNHKKTQSGLKNGPAETRTANLQNKSQVHQRMNRPPLYCLLGHSGWCVFGTITTTFISANHISSQGAL
jgi:hypothetical protein